MISTIECGDPKCLECYPRWTGPMPRFDQLVIPEGLDQLPERQTILAGSVSEELEELEIDAQLAREVLADIEEGRTGTVSLDEAIAELGMTREDLGVH